MLRFAEDTLSLTLQGEIAVLAVDRPASRNALTLAIWSELPRALDAVLASAAKVLIVRGVGAAFSAGADIVEFQTAFATRASTAAYAEVMGRALAALSALDRPVIAAIQGPCIGAGLALALACDLRIAQAGARFGVTPARLGLLYAYDDMRRLVDAIGGAAAKDLLFTARLTDADEALRLGLVGAVLSPDAFEAEVERTGQSLAALSQWTIRTSKALVADLVAGDRHESDRTRALFAEASQGEDHREGLAAFLGKRAPVFPFS